MTSLGFAALWLRDVPFNVPSFGDAGQLHDPFVYLGLLAGTTERIALGVASIMTILSSQDIEHPPLEALFTIDEETGMTGAQELKGGLLNGEILLNLDTEDDDELTYLIIAQ